MNMNQHIEELKSDVNWDQYFISICKVVASKSKDPSTKVGAVIVGPNKEIRSTGWNGMCRGVKDFVIRYQDRDMKYNMITHSEINAICNAARVGTPLNGCSIYVYPLYPCNECAKAIIQVGIKEVIAINAPQKMKIWEEKMKISKLMFDEAGIIFRLVEDEDSKDGTEYEQPRIIESRKL